MRKVETWHYELEFCEKHIEHLLSFLSRRWKKTNEEVFWFIMEWTLKTGWHFIEGLHSYFSYNFPTNREYLAKLVFKYG